MAQRPMVRPDSADTSSSHQTPLASQTKPLQRNNSAGYPSNGNVAPDPSAALDEVLRLVAEQACLATSASASAIALREGYAMVCRATAGPNAPEVGARLNADSGLTGACVRSGQVQYCEDTEIDPRVNAEVCRRLEVRSVLVLPLHHAGELVGIIEIFSPFPQAFAPHDLENLDALSRVILENIRPSVAMTAGFPFSDQAAVEIPEPWDEIPAPPVVTPAPPLELSAIRWEPAEVQSPWPGVAPVEEIAGQDFPEPTARRTKVARETGSEPSSANSAVNAIPLTNQRFAPHAESSSVPEFESPAQTPITTWERETGLPFEPPPPLSPAQLASPAAASSPQTTLAVAQHPHSHDWTNGFLTVIVIALALLLGWMLGRVGWRVIGEEKAATSSSNTSIASSTQGAPGNAAASAAESDSNAVLPVPPAKSAQAPNRQPQIPLQPAQVQKGAPSDGGLVVYEDGKIIFEQTAPRGKFRHPVEGAGAEDISSAETSVAGNPVSLSPQVASAYLIRRAEPVYPEAARQNNIEGDVHLEALVGKDGVVQVLRLTSGNPQLAEAAADAVRQWRFRPYIAGGKAHEFSTQLTVSFRLH